MLLILRNSFKDYTPANIYLFKVTIETLEKGVNYAQSYQWKHQNDAIDVVLVFSLLTLNIFYTFF